MAKRVTGPRLNARLGGGELPRGGVRGKVRATGPHLRWNVSLNDARVDPAIFIGTF